MTDYAVKVSVRNNRILRALRESGYESQMDFCRKTGFPQGELNQLVNMRRPAYGRWGGWAKPAHKLALLLGLEPEDLFTQRQGQGLEVNAVEVEMTECQVCGILGQSDSIEALEARQEVSKLISYLTDREKGVIRARMEGETLDEIGEVYGVNKERIRQIEQKAMRKMKIRMVKGDNAAEQGMPISMIYR